MKKLIQRRLAELLIAGAICSVIPALIQLSDDSFFSELVSYALLGCVILFVGYNIKCLRESYYAFRGKIKYYKGNYIAYAIYALIGILVYECFGETVYTFLFSITKVVKYFGVVNSTLLSAMIFHLIMCGVIIAAPAGVRRKNPTRFR